MALGREKARIVDLGLPWPDCTPATKKADSFGSAPPASRDPVFTTTCEVLCQEVWNPTGPEGGDLEDFPGAAEERCRAIQRQTLHQPLRGAREEEMNAPLGEAIDEFLQHARQLAGYGRQGRKLVEDQRGPRRAVSSSRSRKGSSIGTM